MVKNKVKTRNRDVLDNFIGMNFKREVAGLKDRCQVTRGYINRLNKLKDSPFQRKYIQNMIGLSVTQLSGYLRAIELKKVNGVSLDKCEDIQETYAKFYKIGTYVYIKTAYNRKTDEYTSVDVVVLDKYSKKNRVWRFLYNINEGIVLDGYQNKLPKGLNGKINNVFKGN